MLGASLNSSCQRTPTQQHSLAGAQLSVLPCRTRSQAPRALKVTVSKQSEPERQPLHSRIAGPIAAALVASLLVAGAAPTDALAARSGGRAGGSAFRGGGSSMRSAAPRSAPAPRAAPSAPRAAPGGGTTIRNYNYNSYSAPPLGGYGGFSPFGGGFSPFGGFRSYSFIPIGGGSGIFTFLFTLIAASTVINVVKGISSNKRRDDDFD